MRKKKIKANDNQNKKDKTKTKFTIKIDPLQILLSIWIELNYYYIRSDGTYIYKLKVEIIN